MNKPADCRYAAAPGKPVFGPQVSLLLQAEKSFAKGSCPSGRGNLLWTPLRSLEKYVHSSKWSQCPSGTWLGQYRGISSPPGNDSKALAPHRSSWRTSACPEKDKGVLALGMPDVVLLTIDLENSNCVCDQTIKVAGVNRLAIVSIPYLLAQRHLSSLPT